MADQQPNVSTGVVHSPLPRTPEHAGPAPLSDLEARMLMMQNQIESADQLILHLTQITQGTTDQADADARIKVMKDANIMRRKHLQNFRSMLQTEQTAPNGVEPGEGTTMGDAPKAEQALDLARSD